MINHLKFNFFKGLTDVNPLDITDEKIVDLIRSNYTVKDLTDKFRYYRSINQLQAASYIKNSMPNISVSVLFKDGKARENVVGWNPVIMVDIDHIPDEQMSRVAEIIHRDEHTWMSYITISGKGIRIFVRFNGLTDNFKTNETIHAVMFYEVNQYYAKLTGCETDEKCKNCTRLSVLAHDPHPYVNDHALPFEYKVVQERIEQVRKTARIMKINELNSSKQQKKRLASTVKYIEAILKSKGVEYKEHNHNNYVMQFGYLLNAYGIDRETAMNWAENQFKDYSKAKAVVKSCYNKTEEFNTLQLPDKQPQEKKKKPSKPDFFVIEAFLKGKALFRKNCITGFTEICYKDAKKPEWREMTDRDTASLWLEFGKINEPVPLPTFEKFIISDFVPIYNPFVEYLSQCTPWDGETDYITELAKTVHTNDDDQFFQHFFKKWFVAMVASLIDDTKVNHQILVLTGPQGIYKSTWINFLLPLELRRYFTLKTHTNHITKDDHLALSEFAIICLEEIDQLEGPLMAQLKALTTEVKVTERAPYAHFKESHAHRASFAGTTNNPHFIGEVTGSRRFLPVEVVSIDNPHGIDWKYPELYGQALALIEQGYRYWLTDAEIKKVNEHNRAFEMPCLERELILTYFRKPMPGEEAEFMSTSEIMKVISTNVRQVVSLVKIGLIMKQLGFEACRTATKRGFLVMPISPEKMEANRKAMARYLRKP